MREISDKFEFFYGYDHPLSQWYPSDFSINGVIFNSCEQWMMYSKANLFKDFAKAREILSEPRANFQRRLGRQVRFFKDEIWRQERIEIVRMGNHAKFSQNAVLKEYLVGTSDKIIAESSPTDLIWGIGFSEDNPNSLQMDKWRGENLLGKILMELRSEFQ